MEKFCLPYHIKTGSRKTLGKTMKNYSLIYYLLKKLGILYVHGRDHRFRPIVFFNPYKINTKEVIKIKFPFS